MGRVTFDISVSLDGYVAGPDPGREQPLGAGGEQLHQWIFGLASWRERQGLDGGERGVDDEVVEESVRNVGAYLMGRRMFGADEGPWGDDPWNGWWGDDPPFGVPVFVLTHHPRERLVMQGGSSFTFVTDGIESALEQARAAAGDRDVAVAGGANLAQQYLAAGLIDELQLHLAPVLLGGGVRLFDHVAPDQVALQPTRVIESPAVTHLRYRVLR
jgi:dihydrofolate reductase